MRRAALSPYFSMQSVRRLQPVIQESVDKMLVRLKGFREGVGGADAGQVLMASWAFAAFTNGKPQIFSGI
jgi:cytochrome P450